MNEDRKYSATDKMSDLICDNYSILMVMSRFNLSLGFGDKTVKEVCESQQVDTNTFLAVVNFINEGLVTYSNEMYNFSLTSMIEYLKNAHSYFIDFALPMIRRKLIEAIDFSNISNVSFLILKFFDDFTEVVRKHMDFENKAIFNYVDKLLDGQTPKGMGITNLTNKHDQIDTKLKELKNIIIKYYPETSNNNLLNSVLFDIFNCEHDLDIHCQIEDFMFVPAVVQLEKKIKNEQ